MKKKKIIPIILVVLGLLLVFYPWISDFVNSRQADSTVSTYQNAADQMSDEQLKEMLAQAKKYNKSLVGKQKNMVIPDPFTSGLEGNVKEAKDYDALLNFGGGVMGWVRIPEIGVRLPVYHGVTQEVLEKGIGHIPGTSLPVGGKNTHAVLTGHTGLSTARMFTDLVKLKKGDLFFVYTCNKTFAYKVKKIYIIEPDKTDSLTIQKGKDLVSLLTCYPYGVNTHRLCVEGVRTPYTGQDQNLTDHKPLDSNWMRGYLRAVLLGLAIAAVFIILRTIMKKIKERR